MEKVKISEEALSLLENDSIIYPEDIFNTKDEIEVRIPFTGYYSLKVKCKEEQSAMLQVLKENEIMGITSIKETNIVIDDIEEDETYCLKL